MYGHLSDAIVHRLTEALMRRELFAIVANAAAFRLTDGVQSAQAACKKVSRKCDKNGDCRAGARCKGDKRSKCRGKT